MFTPSSWRYGIAIEVRGTLLELGEIFDLFSARCEPNSRWMLTPRSDGVSMRWRCSCGRMSPTRCVAAVVWPLTWQSKQVTPRMPSGFSVLRSAVR